MIINFNLIISNSFALILKKFYLNFFFFKYIFIKIIYIKKIYIFYFKIIFL